MATNIAQLPVVETTTPSEYLFSARTSTHMAAAGRGQTQLALGLISWHSENPQFSELNSAFIGNGPASGKDRAETMNGTVKEKFATRFKCSEQLVSLSYSCVISTLKDATDSALNELMVITPSEADGKKTKGGFVTFDYKSILQATKRKENPLVFAIKTATSATTEDQTVATRVKSATQGVDRAITLIDENNQADDAKNGVVIPGGIKLKITDPATNERKTERSEDNSLTPAQILELADMATRILMELPAGFDLNDPAKKPSSRLTDGARLEYNERKGKKS